MNDKMHSDDWVELEATGIWVPVRAIPKERPQVGKHGAYYTPRYKQFRKDVTDALFEQGVKAKEIDFPISIELMFRTDGFYLQLRPLHSNVRDTVFARPTHVRGDVDNLAGGVMDALQDGSFLTDDKWVLEAHTRLWEEK